MTLVFYIIIAFAALITFGQLQNSFRIRTVKKYFKTNKLDYILVCNDSKMTDHWVHHIDRQEYSRIEIVDISDRDTSDTFMILKLQETTVRKVGVMRFPCLLILENNELKGRAFE